MANPAVIISLYEKLDFKTLARANVDVQPAHGHLGAANSSKQLQQRNRVGARCARAMCLAPSTACMPKSVSPLLAQTPPPVGLASDTVAMPLVRDLKVMRAVGSRHTKATTSHTNFTLSLRAGGRPAVKCQKTLSTL